MGNPTDSEGSSRRGGLPRALRLNFDHSLVSPGVVGEIAFVNRQKQQAVASGIELGTPANENEIIVVRADHSDERSGRLVSYQLLGIRQIGYSFRPRGSTARGIQDHAAACADANMIAALYDQPGACPVSLANNVDCHSLYRPARLASQALTLRAVGWQRG